MKFFLSEEAEKNFLSIKDFIMNEWSEKSAQKFSLQVFQCLIKISNFPEMYPYFSKPKGIRKCKVSKHTIAFYRIRNSEIEVLAFKDERQDSRKFKF